MKLFEPDAARVEMLEDVLHQLGLYRGEPEKRDKLARRLANSDITRQQLEDLWSDAREGGAKSPSGLLTIWLEDPAYWAARLQDIARHKQWLAKHEAESRAENRGPVNMPMRGDEFRPDRRPDSELIPVDVKLADLLPRRRKA